MVEEIMKDTDIEQLLAEFESVGQDVVAIRQWVDHGNGEFGRNRRQALEAFPMLVMPLFRLSTKPIYREIEWAIDWGYSLVDAWSRGVGVKKESVRYLGRKGPALVGSAWLTDPARLLQAVDLVPSGKRPRVWYEWTLFRILWEGCLSDDNNPHDQTVFSPSEPRQHQMEKFFIELCSGGYDAFDRLLEKLWQGNPDRLRDVSDYFSFIRSWCATGTDLGYINEHVSNAAYGTIADEFLMKYSAMELIRQSERWHRVMEQISPVIGEDLDQQSELHSWPDLPGFPFPFHRHTVVLLTNAHQLLVEGRRLLHCVGGYVNSCVLGKSHILSIRDCAGTSLSTAEIAIHCDVNRILRVEIIQHRSVRNSDPDAECCATLSAALEMLRSEAMQLYLKEVHDFHEHRRERVEQLLATRGQEMELPPQVRCQLMKQVLRDYDKAITWLEKQLEIEEGLFRLRNSQAEDKARRLGFGNELTERRYDELCRNCGELEVLTLFMEEHHWSGQGGY